MQIYQFNRLLSQKMADLKQRQFETLLRLPKTLTAEALALQVREIQGYLQALSDVTECAKDAEQEAYGEKGESK